MDSPIFVLKHYLNNALYSNIDYYKNRAYDVSEEDREKTLSDLMEQKSQVEQAIKLLENYKPQSIKTCDAKRKVCPVCKKTFQKGWGEFCSQDCWDTDM